MKSKKRQAAAAPKPAHRQEIVGADVVLADQNGRFYSIPIDRLADFLMNAEQVKELTEGDVFARSARLRRWAGEAAAAPQRPGAHPPVPEFDPTVPMAPLPVIAFPTRESATPQGSAEKKSVSLNALVRLRTG